MSASRFLVTGASGQLGRLVIDGLLKTVPAAEIGVLVRSDKAAAEFAARGLHGSQGLAHDPRRPAQRHRPRGRSAGAPPQRAGALRLRDWPVEEGNQHIKIKKF